jgi:hypothetical protein
MDTGCVLCDVNTDFFCMYYIIWTSFISQIFGTFGSGNEIGCVDELELCIFVENCFIGHR